MGIENRGYYRDSSESWGAPTEWSTRSIVVILIIINSAVFLAALFTPYTQNTFWLNQFLQLQSDLPWQAWRWLTYGFAHGSAGHLVFNMITFYFLGRHLENELGWQELLKFYLVAIVVSGSAFTLLALSYSQRTGCLGASGAVMAVLMLFVLRHRNEKLQVWGVVETPAWVVGAVLIGLNVLMALVGNTGIAVQVHLMGAFFAAVYHYGHWNFSWIKLPEKRFRSHLQIHDPDSDNDDSSWGRLQQEADRILEKISKEGESSLTGRERKTLKKYSEKIRSRRK